MATLCRCVKNFCFLGKNVKASTKEPVLVFLMWYEYPIPADYKKQRIIIRKLRRWIETLETRGIVEGFAFNHYYPTSATLNIRFDCSGKKELESLREELTKEVKPFIPDYDAEKSERLWDAGKSPEHVYKAYELGTRCVFLFWELVDKGRFKEEFASDFLKWIDLNRYEYSPSSIPFVFQLCFSHGLMNSLGVSKIPNEQLLRLMALIESTKSSSTEELYEWIKNQPMPYVKKAK